MERPENVPLPDRDEIGLDEDDPLEIEPENVPLPEDDPNETTSYNPKYEEFLATFETLRTNEEKMLEDPSSKNLPTLKTLRENTILKLKEIRKDVFDTLYQEYLLDSEERQKILSNKDSYKPFESKNEDVEDFIELSKNISQLEKGKYTEKGKELMFLLGREETTPAKNTLKKILDYLKDKKYSLLIIGMVATLLGLFVDLEEQLNKAQKKLKELIVKQLLKKLKNVLQRQLLLAADSMLQAVKDYMFYIVLGIVVVLAIYYKM